MMMGRGIRIGRVFGINVVLDTSWFIFIFVLVWNFSSFLSEALPIEGLEPQHYLVMAVLAAILSVVSLVAHELAHALVAQRKGITVETITLFIFGGVAHIKSEPERPGDEFLIAGAGPLMSVVLGAFFFGLHWAAAVAGVEPAANIFWLTSLVNALFVGFNMVPGFPLDGGRILRSAVWKMTGDVVKATRIASIGGRLAAVTLIAWGLYQVIFRADISGIWSILIGIFLDRAASTSYNQVLFRKSLDSVSVGELMTPKPDVIPGNLRIGDAIEGYFMKGNQSAFPVVGYADALEGLLTLQQVRAVPRERWEGLTVRQVMFPIQPALVTQEDEPISKVVDRLVENPTGRFLVMHNGDLVGLLSMSDVVRRFGALTK